MARIETEKKKETIKRTEHRRPRVREKKRRLRAKAKDCEFGDQTNDRILEQLIQTIKDNDLIKKSIQKR